MTGSWILRAGSGRDCDHASDERRLRIGGFCQRVSNRFFDVAIAEQHAATFAAGLAAEGLKPVCTFYSTFSQRAFDQIVHDVAIQDLSVLFPLDRGGLVGADGATHHGSFDLSFLRCIPNLVIMAPSDENECRQMLYTGYKLDHPAIVRYPRGRGPGVPVDKEMHELPLGKARLVRTGNAPRRQSCNAGFRKYAG